MEMIELAFFRALSLHFAMCVIMVATIILCVFASRKKDSMAIFAIAIGAFLIIYCATSIVPLVKDYAANNVVQVEGIYINSLGDKSKSASSALGEYAVTLETADGNIALTTVPFSKDIFPTGTYSVTAWYTENSKRLLYIEIERNETSERTVG